MTANAQPVSGVDKLLGLEEQALPAWLAVYPAQPPGKYTYKPA